MTQPVELDRGPVATVYTGWHAGKPVVWKVFPGRFDRRTLFGVRRDQARLSALRAPILRIDAVEHWENRQAVRMELCAESLAARVHRAGPLPVADVVSLGHHLALGLTAAHRAGVLHGGVHPGNGLFKASGQPVLSDFGVELRTAFPRDPLRAIEYVSPETLRSGKVTEQSDLYGLGAVLYFALTGGAPHPGRPGEQPGERAPRVLHGPAPEIGRPGVPEALVTVITSLLAGEVSDAAWVLTRLAGLRPRQPERPPATRRPAARWWPRPPSDSPSD